MMASVALGGLIVPHMMLPPRTMQATGTYYLAKAKTWFASGTTAEPGIMVDYGGEQYEASARIVAAHPYFRDSAAAPTSMIVRGLRSEERSVGKAWGSTC